MLCLCLSLAAAGVAQGQVRVSGIVYDITQSFPLEAVSIMSTSGSGTISDSLGRYTILTGETDSIWFSYLNKPTPKYPVNTIRNRERFEIALHVNATELKPVRIMPPDYKRDSIQNRLDYAKAFDFQKPGIGTVVGVGPSGGAGLDINEFINMFRFRQNRRMLGFQERLLREEAERFIDHRFSRALIIKLTGLRGASLETFIVRYRPPLDFTQESTDYEFQEYIKKCHQHYRRYLRLMNELRLRDEE